MGRKPVGLPVTKILTQPAGPPLRIEYSTDHLGQTVSSQFGVTTQWLNQVLWAVGATRQFNEVMHWTEDQLDAGQGNTPITVFDGKLLADLHPGLRHLRGKPIEVVISRTLDPMVYMPPDPNALIPDVGWPMSLGVYGLQIRFKSPDRVHASGRRRVGTSSRLAMAASAGTTVSSIAWTATRGCMRRRAKCAPTDVRSPIETGGRKPARFGAASPPPSAKIIEHDIRIFTFFL